MIIKHSDKNKLQKIINLIDSLDSKIEKTRDKNIKTKKKIYSVNDKREFFYVHQSLSNEWIDCTPIYDRRSEDNEWNGSQIVEWNISLGQIDIRFLPFLKYDIIYKFTSNKVELITIFGLKNFYYSFEDVESSEYQKKVTFHASCYFSPSLQLKKENPVQAKLLLVWDKIPIQKKQYQDEANVVFNSSIMTRLGWPNGLPNTINPLWNEEGETAGGGIAG